jgi:hypothetical protein
MSLLTSIAYYITIYIGILIYIFGFSGSLLNIRIQYSNRNNPCIFLLVYSSIVDCIVVNIGLLPRILAVGFNIDPTLYNLTWCKVRTYGLRISTLISLYTICLMSIDRLFVSCRTVRWRQLSNISFVRWTTSIVTFCIVAEGLPFLILTQIIQTSTSSVCTPMYNLIFSKYASYFCIPVLFGILPLGVLVTMSILIYHKLHSRTHLRKAQRSLTLIILLRILFVLISCGPYASYFVYSAIVSVTVVTKSAERIAAENFVLGIVSVFLYITYSSSFFVYYFASPAYRKQLTDLLKCPGRRRGIVQPAHVVVTTFTQRNAQTIINHHNQKDGTT